MFRFRTLLITLCLVAFSIPLWSEGMLHDPREKHLADVKQLTFGGENAEAYWSPDGQELVFQSTRPPYACDQIFRLDPTGEGDASLVSTGVGRTTCA